MRCLQSSGHNSRIIAPPFRTTRMQLWSSSRHPPSRMRRSLHASQVLKEKENTPLSPSEANSQSDMVKEAWEELNNNTMTLGSVLGKDNISRLETQLGKAKVDQIAGGIKWIPPCCPGVGIAAI